MRKATFEPLDRRTLLSGAPSLYDESGELIPPTGTTMIGLGGPFNEGEIRGITEDYGIRKDVTVIISDEYVTVSAMPARSGNFKLPVAKPDGSVHLTGSSDADQITVERVVDTQDNINDDEMDFVTFYDELGNYRIMPNSFDPTINAMQRAQMASSLADAKADLAAAIADGSEERIASGQQRVTMHEQIIARHDVMQADLAAGKYVRYTLAGVYDFYALVPDDLKSSAKITIDAGAGSDQVTVGTSVPIKASIFGGSGADILMSGKRAVQMFGGGGNDRLISRSIKGGTLDGGKGSDRYYNRGSTELNVVARNDGDRLGTTSGEITISRPGVFGTTAIERRSYYLVQGVAGQIDLLS